MKNAIVIEDEKAVAQNLISTLKEVAADIQVKTVLETVRESVDYLKQHSEADIIFCDVQLTDGLSFSIFNEVHIDIPIIFITAHDYDEEYVFKGYRMGGVDYIYKPIDPALLRAKVSVFVELYRKNQQLQLHEKKLVEANKALQNEI